MSRRRRGALAPTLAALGVLVVAAFLLASVWTDVLWYRQLGYVAVYRTELITKIGLFAVGALLMAAAVSASLLLAYRSRPVYAPVSTEQASLDRYRETLEPLRRLVGIAVPVGLALFAGSAASQQWQTFLLWWNAVPFHRTDMQFHLDLGFYVFTLPWLQFICGFLTAVVFLAGLAAVVTHYLYGGLRLQGAGPRMTSTARIHLASLAAAFLVLRAVDYWLSRYELTTTNRSLLTGLNYADTHAVLTAKGVLSAIALIIAVLFVVAALIERWRPLPVYGVALLVVSAILLNGIYPAIVQRFQVKPSEQSLEAPYIKRNIDATRAAFGLDNVEVTSDYGGASPQATPQVLRTDAASIPGIRLIDPELIGDTYRALQSLKGYYTIPGVMDVDRYTINKTEHDTVLGVRDINLDGLQVGQRGWNIDHIVYTHGFGVVAAYGTVRTGDGSPAFFEKDIPSSGLLDPYEARIYFGENSPDYSIVGAPKDAPPRELDYPADNGDDQAKTTYAGSGGVPIGSFFNRFLYALKFKEQNILLSDALNSHSRILYDRSPRERVQKVAPYLTLDGDPYPAVVDRGDGSGRRVVWILDGYTTSNRYPYSRLADLNQVTSDSLTSQATNNNVVALQSQQVNYIRNSVKAVVDAFDGSVTLYAWDDQDPVLQAWRKVFPSTVRPLADMNGDLMSHMRYPEDLFKVQRTLLARYHVDQPDAYYTNEDYWAVPTDPTEQNAQNNLQPPYYLSLQMPGTDQPRFSLTSVYVPQGTSGSRVMSGFLAVDSDAGTAKGQRRGDYGKLRLLQLAKNTSIPAPAQMQNRFSDPSVSGELNILRNQGSTVEFGNMLTLPLGGSLLYVEPVYVKAKLTSATPFLKKVLVGFGDKIGFADTLDQALTQVFGPGGATGGTGGTSGTPPPSPGSPSPSAGTSTPPPSASPGAAGSAQADLTAALSDAQAALTASDNALKAGDFQAYGAAQSRLRAAVQRALAAEQRLAAAGVSPTARGAASASASKPPASPTG
ncbi:MAG TPA: UPF0182 family protein [Kineosporiaceae bacterium]